MRRRLLNRSITRRRRIFRVRKKLHCKHIRLSIFKSNKHLYAQLIDDENHKTLLGLSTMGKGEKNIGKSKENARKLGENIAKLAVEKKIETIVFDRGRYKYHGIIAEFANSARKAGLKF